MDISGLGSIGKAHLAITARVTFAPTPAASRVTDRPQSPLQTGGGLGQGKPGVSQHHVMNITMGTKEDALVLRI
jgi:hypothetical protein